MPSAANIAGEKFGQLLAVRPVHQDERGTWVWQFVCDCGKEALRSVARVRYAVKCGGMPMCQECRDELFRGVRVEHFNRRLELYQLMWAEYGSLYSPLWEEVEALQLRTEMVTEGLCTWADWEEAPPPLRTLSAVPYAEVDAVERQQRAWFIVPLPVASRQHGFVCVDCKSFRRRSFACVGCVSATCYKCVRDELHACGTEPLSNVPNTQWYERFAQVQKLERCAVQRPEQIKRVSERKVTRSRRRGSSLPSFMAEIWKKDAAERPWNPDDDM